MNEIERLTDAERYELLDSATAHRIAVKALRTIDAQTARIAELEAQVKDFKIDQTQDETRIRQLENGRFDPVERAVLAACAEVLLVQENGRVRAPREYEVELILEAELAKRQERGLADNEEGTD